MIEALQALDLLKAWVQANAVMLYLLYNCMIQSLPDPDTSNGKLYVFFYRFMHFWAGNLNVVRKQLRNGKAPGQGGPNAAE